MPESDNLKKFKGNFVKYLENEKRFMQDTWNGDTDFPGKASMGYEIKETNDAIKATITLAGQKMWTMEFGRGHNDENGDGVRLSFIKTKIFKDYSSSPVFSEGRKLASVERYKKAQYRKAILRARKKRALSKNGLSSEAQDTIKTKYSTQGGQHGHWNHTGGKAYNIVRIFTRSGSYSDIDSPNNIHRGSGIGGKYGLNTEAFAFHKGGKYKGVSLARTGNPVIRDYKYGFPIRNFELLGEKAKWSFKKDDRLYTPLIKGLKADIYDIIREANKNRK